jgi:hypothetical protein
MSMSQMSLEDINALLKWKLERYRLSCKLGRDLSMSQMSLKDIDALLKWKLEGYEALARLSCKLGRDMSMSKMSLEDINALLKWKLEGYAASKAAVKKGISMQTMITIECKVDFADKDKMPELTNLACSMATTLEANIQLLGPTTKPEIVVYNDDFMSGPIKIDRWANLIAQGKEQMAAVGTGATAVVTDEEQPSDELLSAMGKG